MCEKDWLLENECAERKSNCFFLCDMWSMCFDCSAALMQVDDVLFLFVERLSVYLSRDNYLCLHRMTTLACETKC